MQIYIHRGGRQLGPFTEEQVQASLNSGELAADDLAWFEGQETWQPLKDLAAPPPVTAPAIEAEETAPAGPPDWVPPRRDGTTQAPSPFVVAARGAPSTTEPVPSLVTGDSPRLREETDVPPRESTRRGARGSENRNRSRGLRAIVLGLLVLLAGAGLLAFTFYAGSKANPSLAYLALGAMGAGALGLIVGLALRNRS
jgi:hypothetical protein